ncbi:MAG: cytidylate kinase [Candidatus Poriferisodalaceae bacterium]|jgi:cytidylate kinase
MRVVAIDGPAGAGKSTAARRLAAALSVPYLDTGAMYRSVAFAALQRGIDPSDTEAVADIARHVLIEIGDQIIVDGVDATEAIRGADVTRAVSAVAANTAVRDEMRTRQQAWAVHSGGGVAEGRDIGTVVFPNALVKAYVTARPEVRAKRRFDEIARQQSSDDMQTVEEIAADIERRDRIDSTRADSPLRAASDAVVIDTSDRTVAEVVDELVALFETALAVETETK